MSRNKGSVKREVNHIAIHDSKALMANETVIKGIFELTVSDR